MKKFVVILAAALSFSGCTYAISYDLYKRADKTLSFGAIASDPEAHRGTLVILGGVIVQTSHVEQGTAIEVIQRPLDTWGKPRRTGSSGGNFVIVQYAHLDPLVYSPGREVTVAGEVQGNFEAAVGDLTYRYPRIVSKELKLWPRERPPQYRPDYMDPLLYNPNRSDTSQY